MNQSKLVELIRELEIELEKFDPENGNALVTKVEQDLATLKALNLAALDPSALNSAPLNVDLLTSVPLNLKQSPEEYAFLKAAIEFKESHPKLSSTLNQISYLLSNIGI